MIFREFLEDETGATAVEYGLIGALIAVAILAGGATLTTEIDNKMAGVGQALDDMADSAPETITAGGGGD